MLTFRLTFHTMDEKLVLTLVSASPYFNFNFFLRTLSIAFQLGRKREETIHMQFVPKNVSILVLIPNTAV
jgi:hypothetical protein